MSRTFGQDHPISHIDHCRRLQVLQPVAGTPGPGLDSDALQGCSFVELTSTGGANVNDSHSQAWL
jgi:hypothetical protein